MRVFGIVMFWVLFLPLSSIWYGFVLSILWAWFMMPAFHLPSLSIALAIGISIIVRMVADAPRPVSKQEKDKKSAGEIAVESFMYSFAPPLITLVFGAIVHAFV